MCAKHVRNIILIRALLDPVLDPHDVNSRYALLTRQKLLFGQKSDNRNCVAQVTFFSVALLESENEKMRPMRHHFPEKVDTRSPSGSSSLSSSRRKIGFEPWVGVKNTISRYDMTEEEVENCWLGDDEYVEIRRRNRMVIRHGESFYQLGEPLPDDSYYNEDYSAEDIEQKEDGDYLCIRGLESSSKSGSIRKKTYRRNSIQQVLVEQEYQRVQGFHDETAISELYIEHTSPSKFRAVHLAMEDRIAAER